MTIGAQVSVPCGSYPRHTCKAGVAATPVSPQLIVTGSAVLTRVLLTLIDLPVTLESLVARRTPALIPRGQNTTLSKPSFFMPWGWVSCGIQIFYFYFYFILYTDFLLENRISPLWHNADKNITAANLIQHLHRFLVNTITFLEKFQLSSLNIKSKLNIFYYWLRKAQKVGTAHVK